MVRSKRARTSFGAQNTTRKKLGALKHLPGRTNTYRFRNITHETTSVKVYQLFFQQLLRKVSIVDDVLELIDLDANLHWRSAIQTGAEFQRERRAMTDH